MKAIFTPVIFALFISPAIADTPINTPSGARISFLNLGDNVQVELKIGNTKVVIDSNHTGGGDLPCSTANDFDTFILEDDGTSQYERVMAGLLLARGTGAPVRLNLRNCHTNTANKTRAKIFSVVIDE